MKVTGGHTYSGQGDPWPPALSDSPDNSKLRDNYHTALRPSGGEVVKVSGVGG